MKRALRLALAVLFRRPSTYAIAEEDGVYVFDDVTPNWGEGPTAAAAKDDLLPSLIFYRDQLAKHRRMHSSYRWQLRYLRWVLR